MHLSIFLIESFYNRASFSVFILSFNSNFSFISWNS